MYSPSSAIFSGEAFLLAAEGFGSSTLLTGATPSCRFTLDGVHPTAGVIPVSMGAVIVPAARSLSGVNKCILPVGIQARDQVQVLVHPQGRVPDRAQVPLAREVRQ